MTTTTTTKRGFLLVLALATCVAMPALAGDSAQEKDEKRADIRKSTDETLAKLYASQPAAKAAVKKAAGYAVFNAFGTKILLAGGGSGKGLAKNNKTGATTYMKMVEVQAGLGLGVKKFRLVWVFENKSDLDAFINSGWELGGQATAAAQAAGKGDAFAGAMSVKPGVWLYQITDDGLALELTAKGTKYYKDDDLN